MSAAELDRVAIPRSDGQQFGLLVGRSPAMQTVFAMLERIARSDATVLLQGETGTGKDLAAQSIHLESARRDGPFVSVDCGAIPSGLVESELFGHERGAFTGAISPREGALESASGGTLFLDEIGELAPDLQPKLLRALERREIRRLGSDRQRTVDVRVIVATNRNLALAVKARTFRCDLYYRLAVLTVTMPPLRERPEDIPLLVEFLLEKMNPPGHAIPPLLESQGFLAALGSHYWPGNVRELRNYLERSLALEEPLALEPVTPAWGPPAIDIGLPLRVLRDRWLRACERAYLEVLLREHRGNVAAAARQAGVVRTHLYRLLSRHGLRP